MEGSPIEGLMQTTMSSINEMIDVNTVVGDAVETEDGTVIIPVSRVSFGFAAGGGEYSVDKGKEGKSPFAGGSGAGVTVQPVGFLIVSKGKVKLLPVHEKASLERLIDMAPEVIDKVQHIIKPEDNHKTKRTEVYEYEG